MHNTNRRGEAVAEWMSANDLTIVNRGKSPTFQVKGYSSILDLTVATANIVKAISNWEVGEKENLSDHNYIIIDLQLDKNAPTKPSETG